MVRLSLVLALVAAAPKDAGAVTGHRQGVITGPEGSPFNMPSDAAVGRDGRLYVLDGVNHRVAVYDGDGRFQFQFGSRGDGLGQLVYPLGIATDPNGNVYVADSGNHRFQIFAADGRPVAAVPLPASTPPTRSPAVQRPFGPGAGVVPPDPTDVAVDPSRQRLYVTDNDNHVIHVYNLAERRFESVWGGPGRDQRQFRFPFLIDTSADGYLFVAEPINTRVQVLNPDGKFVSFLGGWGIKPGQLFRPKGVAAWGDRVFVTDSYLGNVQAFTLGGRFLGALADATGAPIGFTTPTGITIDMQRKRLYVVELKVHRVCRVDLE
jgi:DNA-binding beta-propeller fold protein YncE